MKKVFFLLAICLIQIKAVSQVINFDNKGRQLVKFDELGNAVDAHDGEIACFNGTYYLYGTSYDCGFAWQDETAPFCGFKVYESKDLRNWVDKGFLFDAKTAIWQSRCDGKPMDVFVRMWSTIRKRNCMYFGLTCMITVQDTACLHLQCL